MSQWTMFDSSKLKPEWFDLSKISECKIMENATLNEIELTQNDGWSLFADLRNQCPFTGRPLKESTWFLYAAR